MAEVPGVKPEDVKATVDAGHIRAQDQNGVLTVTLPKLEKAKPRQIQVEVTKA